MRVLQGDTYLQIQFDLFGNLTLDTLQSHSIGNNIYLIFKKVCMAGGPFGKRPTLVWRVAWAPVGRVSNVRHPSATVCSTVSITLCDSLQLSRQHSHFPQEAQRVAPLVPVLSASRSQPRVRECARGPSDGADGARPPSCHNNLISLGRWVIPHLAPLHRLLNLYAHARKQHGA